MTLPERFKERMVSLLGQTEAEQLFYSIEHEDAVRAFRINRIKTEPEKFENSGSGIDREKADFPPDAYITREEFPGSFACHHSGAIYMQDISAMSTVYAADVTEGMRVLDSCAAPGGKTTQLSALVGESGIVAANEYDRKRSRILQGNVERMGAKNTVIFNLDTAVLAELYPEYFDLVLCDAPCSGEGMFRKNTRAVEEWSEENVLMCAERQREILSNVAGCVADGGELLYSTCTFSLEENEENVAWFLDKFPEFELIKVNEMLINQSEDGICLEGCGYDMTMCRRIYPHRSHGEGQFVALFRRKDAGCTARRRPHHPLRGSFSRGESLGREKRRSGEGEMLSAAREFLCENLVCDAVGRLSVLGGLIYLVPDIELPEYNVVSAGVCVGEWQKGRIVPHHQLFSAYGNDFKLKIVLDGSSEAASRYLRGEEISAEGVCISADGRESGFAAVIIDGCAVGGAKVSGGVAKNHYPKGIRTVKLNFT